MARVPYDSGADLVAPETLAPRDLQHEQATPNAFGGAIAQGGEALGEGAIDVTKFFGQVQTDSVANNYLKEGNAIVENAGNLKNEDYLNAQAGINKQLDDLMSHYRGQLTTPIQQLAFDTQTRPYRDRLWAGKLATYGRDAAYGFASDTNKNAVDQAANMAAANPDDPAFVAVQAAKARQFSIRQVQTEGLASDPDSVQAARQRGNQIVYKATAQAMAVKNPVGALAFVEAHQADLGAEYGPLAEQIRGRAEQATGIGAGQQAFQIGSQGHISPASATEDPAQLIKAFEGFRTSAYWDVNHWRTGYGSDTVTLADGSVQPVTATTTVTQADADRDLARRTALAGGQAETAIGGSTWQALPATARASITSVAYNYGRVPDSVAAAAKTGNVSAIAQAIDGLQAANNGVNATRRQMEAANALGRFTGPGGSVLPGNGQPMTLPPAAGGAPVLAEAPVPPPTAETPEAPVAAPGVPTLPGAPVPPTAAPAQPVALSPQAIAYQHIDDLVAQGKINANEAQHARETVNQMVYADQVATAQTARARKQAVNEASNEYLTRMMKGDMGNIIPEIANDPRFASDPDAKRALWDLALKKSGDNDPAIYGRGFNDVYQRILAAPGDPKRISDPVDILKLGAAGGPLTFAGTQKALTILNETKKSVDGYGVQATKAGAIDNAKRYLSFEQDTGFVKIRDPEGEKIFDTQFLPRFESAFDDWTVRQGKDPHDFPLFDPKKMDAMLQQLRPKRERDAARMAALGDDVASAPQAAQPAPPAPADVDPDGWNATMRALPYGVNGQPWPVAQWASVVETLRADPTPKTIESFNRHFGGAGFDANEILRRLKPQAQIAPLPNVPPYYGGGG